MSSNLCQETSGGLRGTPIFQISLSKKGGLASQPPSKMPKLLPKIASLGDPPGGTGDPPGGTGDVPCDSLETHLGYQKFFP